MLIDSHAHLTSTRFAADLPAVLERAAAAGVGRMVTIGTGLDDARAALALARSYPQAIACAAGLDPFSCHAAGPGFDAALAGLEALLKEGGFCALGECGLEYHHPLAPPAAQRTHLEAQLALAQRLRLPVILHCRNGEQGGRAGVTGGAADRDLLAILRGFPGLRGVLHSFSAGPAEAEAYLAFGLHLSFNGMATYPGNALLREAAQRTPADRLLVETDAPYLAPVPQRGRRCEPAFVAATAAALAELRAERVEDLAAWTTRNAERLFGLSAGAGDADPSLPHHGQGPA